MTTKERFKLLCDWKEQYELCNNAWLELEKVFGYLSAESPTSKAIWTTFKKYTETMSMLVGDNSEWLDWYCWENKMGEKGYEAKAASWKRNRKIKNIKDLCQIIEADAEEENNP